MDDESQNAQDARVERLWKSLHTGPIAPLDLQGLKAGLEKNDHPLANAEALLKDVLRIVDTSGDGHIDFTEFRTFVEQTEKELWQLFKSIDKDKNGKLDKEELRAAFSHAGVQMDARKLERFFNEVDRNNDGTITFDEWRDFLLFLPTHVPNLRAVSSYYSSTVFSNPEGDTHVSDEGAQGLGNNFLFSILFGALLQAVTYRPHVLPTTAATPQTGPSAPVPVTSIPTAFPWDPGETQKQSTMQLALPQVVVDQADQAKEEEPLLISLLPDPGYFIAGGIAGAISRTATAPLDRLKVYLIAQTSVSQEATEAAKSGSPLRALRTAARPLSEACVTLWKMGGIQSLFAGNGLNVVKVMPESAIKFGSYEGTKRIFAKLEGHGDPKNLGSWSQFISAGMGGVIAQFAVYPLDTLKLYVKRNHIPLCSILSYVPTYLNCANRCSRMQCETVQGGLQGNKLIIATAQKMWSGTGVRSFYRGLGMGLGGMFPYSAIDLTTYEYLKWAITERNIRKYRLSEDDAAPGRMLTGGIGAISSSVGATTVYPVNLLRTRLQSQGTVIHPPTYDGWRDCFNKTIKKEGYRGLYKGLTPNLLKVVPSMSISYMVYETSKKVLGLR